MKSVSRFEANLLRILQGFFGRIPQDQLLKLVENEIACPRCLSRNAIELVKDTLQKGMPLYLAQRGGWRRERFLRHEQIKEGRLWQRTLPEELGLCFSKNSLGFLIWITANHPNRCHGKPIPHDSQLTIGDRLLYFLAYESLRGTEPAQGLMEQAPFKNHSLLWLAYLSDLLEAKAPNKWEFSPWMDGQGGDILESLQTHIAHRWLLMERQKLRIYQPTVMRRLGDLQNQVLTRLFNEAEATDRRDLCRFFLVAMKQHLQELNSIAGSNPSARLYHLNMANLRMSERMEVYQSAALCFRQMYRMDRWNRVALATGYYDEGYAAAQLWKADWEQLDGNRLLALSQAQYHALEPLSLAGSPLTGESPKDNVGETSTGSST